MQIMIAKARLILLTMTIGSLRFGLAYAMTGNTFLTQPSFAQNAGGTPIYSQPGSNTSSGNSTSGNTTR